MSKGIMTYYVTQWIIIGWLEYLMLAFDFPKGFMTVPQYYVISTVITVVTGAIAVLSVKRKELLRKRS